MSGDRKKPKGVSGNVEAKISYSDEYLQSTLKILVYTFKQNV